MTSAAPIDGFPSFSGTPLFVLVNTSTSCFRRYEGTMRESADFSTQHQRYHVLSAATLSNGDNRNFVHMKVMVDADTKRILGAAILGTSGDEAVHSLLDVMYAGLPYTGVQHGVRIHPTVSELIPTLLAGVGCSTRRIKTVRVLTLGITREYRMRGIQSIMMADSLRYLLKKGYTGAEVSWLLEDNELVIGAVKLWGGKLYKTYRIYEKNL
jgi:hypothetical protein